MVPVVLDTLPPVAVPPNPATPLLVKPAAPPEPVLPVMVVNPVTVPAVMDELDPSWPALDPDDAPVPPAPMVYLNVFPVPPSAAEVYELYANPPPPPCPPEVGGLLDPVPLPPPPPAPHTSALTVVVPVGMVSVEFVVTVV